MPIRPIYTVTRFKDKKNTEDLETLKKYTEELTDWFNERWPEFQFELDTVFSRGIIDLQTGKSLDLSFKYNRLRCRETIHRDTWSQWVKMERFLNPFVPSWKTRITSLMNYKESI